MLQRLATRVRKLFQSPAPSKASRRGAFLRKALKLENLEDRCVPTIGFVPIFNGESVTQGNGTALLHIPVQLVFADQGGLWTSATEAPVVSAVQTILNSTYLKGIEQYTLGGGHGQPISDPFAGYVTYNNLPNDYAEYIIPAYSFNNGTKSGNFAAFPTGEFTWGNTFHGGTGYDGGYIPPSAEGWFDSHGAGYGYMTIFMTDPKVPTGITPTPQEINDCGYYTGYQNLVWVETPETSSGAINMAKLTTLITQGLVDQQTQNPAAVKAGDPFTITLPQYNSAAVTGAPFQYEWGTQQTTGNGFIIGFNGTIPYEPNTNGGYTTSGSVGIPNNAKYYAGGALQAGEPNILVPTQTIELNNTYTDADYTHHQQEGNGPLSIGDGENALMPYTYVLNGVTVEAYWSQQDQVFEVPDGTLTWKYPDSSVVSIGGSLGNFQLLNNGQLMEKTTGGTWRVVMSGVEQMSQGTSGGSWASDILALKTDGTLWETTTTSGVFSEIATGISHFAFGNAGTSFANVVWALSGTNLEYDKGTGFVVMENNIESFQIGHASTNFAKDIFTLNTNSQLSYDSGNGFTVFDSQVLSFAFGNAGTSFAGYLVDMHVDGNLDESTGNGLFEIDHYVSSFSFGNAGTTYAGYLFALHNTASTGNLPPSQGGEYGELTYANSVSGTTPVFHVLDTDVVQFALGQLGTSWANTLFAVDYTAIIVPTLKEFTSATFASTSASIVGVPAIAFGILGNGGANDLFEYGTWDTQLPGASGPGTGFIQIYPNTGGEDPPLTGNPASAGGYAPYSYWDNYIYYPQGNMNYYERPGVSGPFPLPGPTGYDPGPYY